MRFALLFVVFGLVAACGAAPSPTRRPASSEPSASVPGAASHAASSTAQPPSPVQTPPPSTAPVELGELTGRLVSSNEGDLWISNANGSHRKRLTTNPSLDFDPSWSPDGKRVAFRTHRTGDEEIYVINADGTGERNVSRSPGGDWSPAWAPSGDLIAMASERSGGEGVWVVRPDGTQARRVTAGEGEYPSWKADSSAIVYAVGPSGLYDIHRVDFDGANDANLTHSPGTYDMSPAWSPDGRYVAYDTQRDFIPKEPGVGPEFEIHVLDLLTGADSRITFNHAEDRFPAWSPDGRFLVWSREGTLVVARATAAARPTSAPAAFPIGPPVVVECWADPVFACRAWSTDQRVGRVGPLGRTKFVVEELK